ncbi:hypothetical protein TIFTF001_051999 [Ficus carica]|uniref:Uncharacterized protein n=1 Tax=Ficus carica TaxID=3494 RepID=A0AA88EFW4_FICCA|nr:hypothetical protein TIFTF001_048422 [Ficus carica]GMN35125.1 hypothetical protein TIFTF001_048423 [Ficus carica]GMN35135.1 hypothetical protein TIFTF001_048424 [Ficus carica]GMN35145.1 hypothetical protein TIFTF001_048425 [Ficus carica]GMN72397.1 hypothetical protein TIFTF001_051998 [Ficus carica]
MYLVSNPGWTEEDREASLAFREMEEELRIFDRTQGVVAQYGDPLQILSCRDVSSGYACQPTPSRGGSCKVPWHRLGALIQMSLWAIAANGSELCSESVVDKLSL